MVKLTKIYTRTGDSGTTGLGTGARVPKAHPRVEAYGCVDETNAFVGLAVATARESHPAMLGMLERIQHDLFDLGADLCTPIRPDESSQAALRVTADQIMALEHAIDSYNADLSALTSFVLPSGSRLASELHVARTVCRRAERVVSVLIEAETEATSGLTMQYLNRLSDLLFVLARVANDLGKGDVLWVPGKNRSEG
ncbi:MAG: cob(I)yrinic acid a,c-diamide adenosyltransferase [Phycisphaerales bacterium]